MDDEIAALREELRAARSRLLDAIAGVGEEQFKRRPAAAGGEPGWCIAEVLAHLLSREKLGTGRIALALERDGAIAEPSTPEQREQDARAGRGAPVPMLVHGLLAARRELERLLERAGAIDGGLARGVVHPHRGRESVAWLLREKIIAHEREHTAQIEAIKAALAAEGRGR